MPPPLGRMFVDLTAAEPLNREFPTPMVWLDRLRDAYGSVDDLNVGALAVLDAGVGWQPHSN